MADVQHEPRAAGSLAQARELVRIYAGPSSAFYQNLSDLKQTWAAGAIAEYVTSNLEAFIDFVESGVGEGVSLRRQAEIDVVSDILAQADQLLGSTDFHPAAAAVLIGAALEEFLRNWTEEQDLSIGDRKPGMEAYSSALRGKDLLDKQDAKDITSWAGVRNAAAHGEWDAVADRARIRLMLEGVNLFMRKHGAAE